MIIKASKYSKRFLVKFMIIIKAFDSKQFFKQWYYMTQIEKGIDKCE